MSIHRCLFCREWVYEDEMIQHLGDAHQIRKLGEADAPGTDS